jgi:ketosteroid isomerase-like protein
MVSSRLDLLRQVFAGWAQGDFRVSYDLLAPDLYCTWEEPPSEVVCRDREEMTRKFRDFLANWSHFRVEPDELIEIHPDAVLVVARQYAVGRESRAETVARVHIVWRFSGEKVTRLHWYFDREAALRKADLL